MLVLALVAAALAPLAALLLLFFPGLVGLDPAAAPAWLAHPAPRIALALVSVGVAAYGARKAGATPREAVLAAAGPASLVGGALGVLAALEPTHLIVVAALVAAVWVVAFTGVRAARPKSR